MLTENAIKILEKRYLIKDKNGIPIETPNEMFRRVAHTIATAYASNDVDCIKDDSITKLEEDFYDMMINCEFLPNSPTLMNAGRPLAQLSGCFVLPIDDSMDSIFSTLRHTSLIHKSGGGTGFDFSKLRPKNSIVKTTTGVSSGPISFIKVYNAATEAIKQGGTRRGANMAILRVDHPDIMEFITCKDNDASITNFNISVAVTDKFMDALENDEEYDLIHSTLDKPIKISAKEVFNKIVEQTWKNGEPGIVFLDRMNKFNPTPTIGEIESTNPCGEQPLLPYESCNLGSINLLKMIKEKKVDWDKLNKTVELAVIFLDNVIEVNKFPLKEIDMVTKSNRKIGLGIMGFADLLIQLEIQYDSEDGLEMAKQVMSAVQNQAKKTSEKLAKERGIFPNYINSIYSDSTPIRNATRTTIAPTGTIGIIAGTSSGIEPLFALVYTRKNILGGEELSEIHPEFSKIIDELKLNESQVKQVQHEGSMKKIENIPDKYKKIFRTALDISPEWHVKMQSVFQQYTDNAVSKTINFQNKASIDDIKSIYILAHKMKCKGITIYRYGSRSKQVLNLEEPKSKVKKSRPRPKITDGQTFKIDTGCGNMYVTINEDENGPCELFTQLGKSGACSSSLSECMSRLISLCLKNGIDMNSIKDQIKGIRCSSPFLGESGIVLSCADGVALAMEEYTSEPEDVKTNRTHETSGENPDCPECGNQLTFGEGCIHCKRCGYSKCM